MKENEIDIIFEGGNQLRFENVHAIRWSHPETESGTRTVSLTGVKRFIEKYLKDTFENVKKQSESKPDPWKHRSCGMKCRTCMFYVQKTEISTNYWHNPPKTIQKIVGRCRRHAPTMNGYPVVFDDDWCGDHKLDENKV